MDKMLNLMKHKLLFIATFSGGFSSVENITMKSFYLALIILWISREQLFGNFWDIFYFSFKFRSKSDFDENTEIINIVEF